MVQPDNHAAIWINEILTANLYLLFYSLNLASCSGVASVLVFFFPLGIRHAINNFPRLIVINLLAFLFGRRHIPLGKTIATKIGQIHQINILHFRLGLANAQSICDKLQLLFPFLFDHLYSFTLFSL